jgi:predicted transcriptional regulator
MKLKEITIGVKNLGQSLKEVGRVMKSIQAGHSPRARGPEIFFVDYNAMRKVLTPRRMELLGLIRDKAPGSVYELSHMAGRDLKNVQDDVALLDRLGFIHITRQKSHRRCAVPHVDYDALTLKVPVASLAHA